MKICSFEEEMKSDPASSMTNKLGAHVGNCVEATKQLARETKDAYGSREVELSKNTVRQRLAYLCSYYPPARPSRGNLKEVYSFARRHMPRMYSKQLS